MTVKRICACGAVEPNPGHVHHLCMKRTKNPKRKLGHIFLKQWRKHRGLSQEQLADSLEISHTTVGRIERSEIPYSQEFLEAAAARLRCTPADIIMRDPGDPEGIWSIWDNLTPPQRRQAVELLNVLKRTGTGG